MMVAKGDFLPAPPPATLEANGSLLAEDMLEDQRRPLGESLANLTLSCDDGTVPVHLSLFTNASPMIKEALADQNPCDPAFIHFDGFSLATVVRLVELVYTGRTVLTEKIQRPLHSLMTLLGVPVNQIQFQAFSMKNKPVTSQNLLQMRCFPKPGSSLEILPKKSFAVEDKENVLKLTPNKKKGPGGRQLRSSIASSSKDEDSVSPPNGQNGNTEADLTCDETLEPSDSDEQSTEIGAPQPQPMEVDDGHDDICSVCKSDGEVILCDSCPRVYHKDCFKREWEWGNPPELWYCPECQNESSEQGSSTSNTPKRKRPPRRNNSRKKQKTSGKSKSEIEEEERGEMSQAIGLIATNILMENQIKSNRKNKKKAPTSEELQGGDAVAPTRKDSETETASSSLSSSSPPTVVAASVVEPEELLRVSKPLELPSNSKRSDRSVQTRSTATTGKVEPEPQAGTSKPIEDTGKVLNGNRRVLDKRKDNRLSHRLRQTREASVEQPKENQTIKTKSEEHVMTENAVSQEKTTPANEEWPPTLSKGEWTFIREQKHGPARFGMYINRDKKVMGVPMQRAKSLSDEPP